MTSKNRYQIVLTNTQRRPRGASKWADAVLFVNCRLNDDVTEFVGAEHKPFPALVEACNERRATPLQERIIAATLHEADRLLRHFRLTPARLGRDRIHLVNTHCYKELDGGESSGMTENGHAYIPVSPGCRTSDFAARLTHEVSHLISYSAVIIDLKNRSLAKPDGLLVGFEVSGLVHAKTIDKFSGLTEVATELTAHILRDQLINAGLIPESEQPRLMRHWRDGTAYGTMALCVLDLLAKSQKDADRVSRLMVRSLLAGDTGFMRLLERRGWLHAIAEVTSDEDSMLQFVVKCSERL